MLEWDLSRGQVRELLLALVSLKRLLDQIAVERMSGRRRRVSLSVPPGCSWDEITAAGGDDIIHRLDGAMHRIEAANPALEGVFTTFGGVAGDDGYRGRRIRQDSLASLVDDLSTLALNNEAVEPDVLGQANEHLLAWADRDERLRGGHYYTPPEVVAVLAGMIGLSPDTRLHDPTCGSGGMLLHAAEWLRHQHGPKARPKLSGQERDAATAALAKLNMVLHDLPADIRGGSSTLTDPQFITRGRRLQTFDAVLANFPFAQRDWGRESLQPDPYGRLEFGMPPRRSGDYAYLQHIVASLGPSGRAGVVCGQSVLFREAESEIRGKMLAKHIIETVVALPPKLFRGVDAPACLIVLNRDEARQGAGKVLFIDARARRDRLPEQDGLEPEDVEWIVTAHHRRRDAAGRCRLVRAEDIAPPLHSLTVGVYVQGTATGGDDGLRRAVADLRAARTAHGRAMRSLDRHLKELGLDV